VLTIGTGGDEQMHVTRPKTASSVKQAKNTIKRVNSELETITEKHVEEDHLAASHNIEVAKFDIEESYAYSLRNVGVKTSQNLDGFATSIEG